MAGHGMLFAEGPTACPFVALESDRDRRAGEPDPRHRCYAEPTPAPRALAHQREFCLSPGFGGCPIFQDWAVRAAARPVPLRPLGAHVEEEPPPAAAGPQQLPAFAEPTDEPGTAAEPGTADEPAPADDEPQPAAEKPPGGDARPAPGLIPPPDAGRPEPEAGVGRSLDPQPIERLPSLPLSAEPPAEEARPEEPPVEEPRVEEPPARPRSRWTEDWPPSAAAAAAANLGGREQPAPAAPPADGPSPVQVGRPVRASRGRREPRTSPREEWSSQRADLIPAWERQRYSAYPGLRSRVGLGDGDALLSRLTRILAVVAIAAVVIALLLLAPGFFAGGPGASPTRSPSPTQTGPTATPSPTTTPQPTVSFGTYVVQAGDALSAIAAQFGLLPCQLQAANPEITDPNEIFIGQVIVIPPDDFALEECLVTPPASP